MAKAKEAEGRKRPLAIVGTAGSSGAAPYDEEIDGKPLYEIWSVGTAQAKEDVKRIDRLFELHPKRYWGQLAVQARMNEFDGPIYMQDHYEDIPKSVKYPYDEVKKKFMLPSMGDNLYVTNTITWIILLAIHEGYKDINLYGVHMAHESEYAYQRSSCSWALGIIHGMILQGEDIKLYIAPESSLFKAEYEYGFGEPTRQMEYVKGRMNGLSKGIEQARQQINNLQISVYRSEGAMQEDKHIFEKLAGFN
jgi:hypothetical protein